MHAFWGTAICGAVWRDGFGAGGAGSGGFADSARCADPLRVGLLDTNCFCCLRRLAALRDDFGDGIRFAACGAALGADDAADVDDPWVAECVWVWPLRAFGVAWGEERKWDRFVTCRLVRWR